MQTGEIHARQATRHIRKKPVKTLVVLAALLSLCLPAMAGALTTISQGYLSDDNLPLGAVVSLQKNTSDHVSAASTDNVNSLLGVVITNDNSLLTLTSGQKSQVQVATSGVVQTLVSTMNGNIAEGDAITASPISGVGMKATDNIKVIGIAQGTLPNNTSSKQEYTDKKGQKHSVIMGSVPVQVSVSYFYKQPDKTIIPTALQNVANALAGKTVNTLPILISAGIFIVTLIVVVSIVYSMIRSSIISVGRNPMSQSAIYRDMVQMSALVVGIIAVGVVSIYLILTRL